MMKGKTIVDTEKLQELLKLVRAFEDQLSAAETATENGELMASDLSERMAETKEDYMKSMNTTVTGSVATLLLITHEMHFLVSDQWGGNITRSQEHWNLWQLVNTVTRTNRQLLKSKGSREMRAFGNNNERSQRSGAKRKGQTVPPVFP